MTLSPETDARTLAAFAVNFARGKTFEPYEFERLSVLAGSYGMNVGLDEQQQWLDLQQQREIQRKAFNASLPAPLPWWRRLWRKSP